MLAYVFASHVGDSAKADQHAARALEQAERLGDPALLAGPLAVSANVAFLRGRGIDWGKLYQALALESQARHLPLLLRPSLIAAMLAAFAGRIGEAREQLATLRIASASSGVEDDLAYVTAWLVWVETIAGRFASAAALADEAVLTQSESTRAWVLAFRALLCAHPGTPTPRAPMPRPPRSWRFAWGS